MSLLHTPVCELLGCDEPVVLSGLGGVARAELVAAVSEAGGFGFLGMVREPPALIEAEIARVRAATGRPFGVNLIPAATAPALLEAELATVLAAEIAAVIATSSQRAVSVLAWRKPIEMPRFSTQRSAKMGSSGRPPSPRDSSWRGTVTIYLVS